MIPLRQGPSPGGCEPRPSPEPSNIDNTRIRALDYTLRGARSAPRRIQENAMRSFAMGLFCATALITSAPAQTLTIGVRGGPDSIDPALHRDRHARRGAEARVRYAGLVGRRTGARAPSRRELEADQRHDLGIQAAPRREVPRWIRLHRGRCQVLDRAHPRRRGSQSDHHLCPAGEGNQDRRPAHVAHRDGWCCAQPAQ